MLLRTMLVLVFGVLVVFSGCCFDLTEVKQESALLQKSDAPKSSWVLEQNVDVPVPSWSTTHLKKETSWQYAGRIDRGDVYKTADQIVTVEGPNIHEAYLVVSNGSLVGFYLPVEKTFTSIKSPIALPMKMTN